MAASKRPSPTDMFVYLSERRDNALEQAQIHEELGHTGQSVYWRTVAVDSGLLLGWMADNDRWILRARSDAEGLQAEVNRLDAEHRVPVAA